MRFLILIIITVCFLNVNAQKISAYVFESPDIPVENVNIDVLGTIHGTFTDSLGYFSCSFDEDIAVQLQISHIAYKTKSIDLGELRTDTLLDNIFLQPSTVFTEELIIKALRASEEDPIAQTNLSGDELSRENLSQDIPYLLRNTPSLITSSDAGNGVGYSSMRIRGSDQSRINVTINGIPYNDAESQQVFWVDLPDIASSLNDIQIQRGVGSSTHGAGAFGASIHLNNLQLDPERYLQLSNSYGAYNTHKHSLKLNSGMLGQWNLNGRISWIKSDGYIDRASSDLKSYFFRTSYINDQTALHLTHFSGKEVTYQSWYGTPQALVEGDKEGVEAFIQRNFLGDAEAQRLLNADRQYNYYQYENQVDDYKQDHFQVHFSHHFNPKWNMSMALHYTKGKGFFEEFRENDAFEDYGLEPQLVDGETAEYTDFIRRRWLDNHFYGAVFNLDFELTNRHSVILGGAFHQYDGDHFGELVSVDLNENIDLPYRYYQSVSDKKDANFYAKLSSRLSGKMHAYLDLQFRRVKYMTDGNDNDLKEFDIQSEYNFFNPKVGLNYSFDSKNSAFLYLGLGQREPDRNDFVDQFPDRTPEAERMLDLELAFKHKSKNLMAELGVYWMDYKDQLVLTGDLNDVGAPLRTNVPDSYRLGLEFMWNWRLIPSIELLGNMNVSRNKISEFDEVIYDYEPPIPETVIISHQNTNISFSPSVVASAGINFNIKSDLSLQYTQRYVGKQYLDNTSNDQRVLKAYSIGDVLLSYSPSIQELKHVEFKLQLNNVWNTLYSANGYTYSYLFGDLITENFLYPQAERNVMLGVDIKI